MTVKLYDKDAYQRTCESKVVSCEKINETDYDGCVDLALQLKFDETQYDAGQSLDELYRGE